MKLIDVVVVMGLSAVGTNCMAAGYSMQEANADADRIWSEGCADFKKGMLEVDFRGALKLDESIKNNQQIKRKAVVSLYMDGWETARNLKGVINCRDIGGYRAADYVSGVDIREGSNQN